MKIQTSRFGELQVSKRDIINFTEGILGFDHLKKFFIVDPGDNTLILWMQSSEEENVAFPIIEPKIFMPEYKINLMPRELAELQLENSQDAKIYCILTIPQDITIMSANLKAPIIINEKIKISKQIVLQDNKLPVRFEMYRELKKYIVDYNSDDSRRGEIEKRPADEEKESKPTHIENTDNKKSVTLNQ